jgi:hypothetical protein
LANAGSKDGDDGDVGCDAGDGAGHAKRLDWMTAIGRGQPLAAAAVAVENGLAMQSQKALAQSPARQDLESVSRYIPQESEIPRGSIEPQEREKVA